MTSDMKPEERERHDMDFQAFLKKLVEVAGYKPRAKYLYPIMRGVPFRDLNTALDMAVMERIKKKANDNR